ncbi:MAG: cytochrome P450 [Kibdelosporangium sp.]
MTEPTDPPAPPMSPGFLANPLPTYAFLRKNQPVAPLPLPNGGRAWLVTRYDDVRKGLTDPLMSNNQAKLAVDTPFEALPAHLRPFISGDVQNLDPPDHTRIRKLLTPAFSAQAAERLRPRLAEVARELIDGFGGRTEVDLIAEYAAPFAGRSFAEICGIPGAGYEQFQSLAAGVVNAIHGGAPDALVTPALKLYDYVEALCAARKAHSDGGLIADLVREHTAGGLSKSELTSTIFGLLIAGQEGTANLIGNGLHLLLTHPAELARLRADARLMPLAVEEFARYTAPLDLPIFRSSPKDTCFAGTTVPANEPIMFSLLSAGHDETQFDRPDRLDIERVPNQHLAFSRGTHFCPGAPLGRVQVQVAIGELLTTIGPALRLAVPADRITPKASVVTRSIAALPCLIR